MVKNHLIQFNMKRLFSLWLKKILLTVTPMDLCDRNYNSEQNDRKKESKFSVFLLIISDLDYIFATCWPKKFFSGVVTAQIKCRNHSSPKSITQNKLKFHIDNFNRAKFECINGNLQEQRLDTTPSRSAYEFTMK